MVNLFNVPVFFITLRETLETAIIVSVLLSFITQTLGHDQDPQACKKLRRQVWLGVILGLVICVCIGAGFIGAFYGLGRNHWTGTEDIWEGSFALVASLIITIIGAGLLRVSKLKAKWQIKLTDAIESKYSTHHGDAATRIKRWCIKYALFNLTFITVLREGLEGVVFVAGIGLSESASSFPLAVISGLGAGCLIGFFIYKCGTLASIQIFLIISTCFLYLIAAGLFSRAVWLFQNHKWGKTVGADVSEVGSGPGSYDISQSVWHVNCCNPQINGGGGWGVFNALFGWQNSATYGSVISYNLYWITIMVGFLLMRYREKVGHWPFMKPPLEEKISPTLHSSDVSSDEIAIGEKGLRQS